MPEPLDAVRVLAAMRPMLVQMQGAGVVIEDSMPPHLWTLRADRNQLELALLGLAANARDAMPVSGRLQITAHNASVAAASDSGFIGLAAVPSLPAGDYVVLTVSDTGAGMDETALARAADPFFTTKGPGKGTGLGLSMVHGFAMQSGGALRLSSRPGCSTTAELWLPRTLERASATDTVPAGRAEPTAFQTRCLRILLVDDDPLVVAGTTAMLEELGHHPIVVATSGEAALAELQRNPGWDLLLTDHKMPGMTGLQLASRVRALYPTLPILLASGYAELDQWSGASWPRLRKPYTLDDLATALSEAVGPSASRPLQSAS
jgi:CheY-like chemotaxis protein